MFFRFSWWLVNVLCPCLLHLSLPYYLDLVPSARVIILVMLPSYYLNLVTSAGVSVLVAPPLPHGIAGLPLQTVT